MNIVTCPKCGFNYEWPTHLVGVVQCPNCFPVNVKYSISTTTENPKVKKSEKQAD